MSSASLLIVIVQPFTEPQKKDSLDKIAEGLSALDSLDGEIDWNTELLNFLNKNVPPEETEDGGLLLRLEGKVYIEILVDPTLKQLKRSLHNFITSKQKYKHLVHAGPILAETGDWFLRDTFFTLAELCSVLTSSDCVYALKEICPGAKLLLSNVGGRWNDTTVKHWKLEASLEVKLNPEKNTGSSLQCLSDLSHYFSQFISRRSTDLMETMKRTKVVGNVHLSRPTVYVFPGGDGHSAFFGIRGFNLVLDGGYGARPAYWDFVRHLDRMDALLISGMSPETVYSTSHFLQRLGQDPETHPHLGLVYANFPPKPAGDARKGSSSPLAMSIFEETAKMEDSLATLRLRPHPVWLSLSPKKTPEPIRLYYKAGHGQLDMYPLNPSKDSKQMKELSDHWKKGVFNQGKGGAVPLMDATSIAVMLVWIPAVKTEEDGVKKILLPGSCPPQILYGALEKMKGLEFMKSVQLAGPKQVVKARPTPISKPASAKPVGRPTNLSDAAKPVAVSDHAPSRPAPPVSTQSPAGVAPLPIPTREIGSEDVSPPENRSPRSPPTGPDPTPVKVDSPISPKEEAPMALPVVQPDLVESPRSSPIQPDPHPVKGDSPMSPTENAIASPVMEDVIGSPNSPIYQNEEQVAVQQNLIGSPGPDVDINPAPVVPSEQVDSPGYPQWSSDAAFASSPEPKPAYDNGGFNNSREEGAGDAQLPSPQPVALQGEDDTLVDFERDELAGGDHPMVNVDPFRGYGAVQNQQGQGGETNPFLTGEPFEASGGQQHFSNGGDYRNQMLDLSEESPHEQAIPDPFLTKEMKKLDEIKVDFSSDSVSGLTPGIESLNINVDANPTVENNAVMDPFPAGIEAKGQELSFMQGDTTAYFTPNGGPTDPEPGSPMGGTGQRSPEGAMPHNHHPFEVPHQPNESQSPSLEQLKNEWGQPLGLPPPSNAPAAAKGKKPLTTPTTKGKESAKPSSAGRPTSGSSGRKAPSAGAAARPTSAGPAAAASGRSARGTGVKAPPPTKSTGMGRGVRGPAAAAGGRKQPPAEKPALSSPIELDLAYIPNVETGLDADFFRLIRAKFFVLSCVQPKTEVLDALLAGKKAWGQPDKEVQLVPTYDSENLHLWMRLREEELEREGIVIAPSAVRCQINLDNHGDTGDTCAAYRLQL